MANKLIKQMGRRLMSIRCIGATLFTLADVFANG